jgi:DNA processing protein
MQVEELARLCAEPPGRFRRSISGQIPLPDVALPDWMARELDPRGPGRRRWEELAEELARGPLRMLRPGEPDYPWAMRGMEVPPDPLFVLGGLELLRQEAVAIVGTRRPDRRGLDWAGRMASALSRGGVVVVSGGAMGVDAEAHRRAGFHRTVAVLGSGFAQPYPREHVELFERIAREGLLISEWPPWTRPETWRFPRRNRVIAGLSRAVLVAQAPTRSGALSTARHAVEEGREVWVCPGPWDDPLYAGNHHLIRQGARLCASVDDLREDVGSLAMDLSPPVDPPPVPAAAKLPSAAPPADQGLWEALGQPRLRDELALRLGTTPGELAGRLVAAEMEGWARSLPGDRWARQEDPRES